MTSDSRVLVALCPSPASLLLGARWSSSGCLKTCDLFGGFLLPSSPHPIGATAARVHSQSLSLSHFGSRSRRSGCVPRVFVLQSPGGCWVLPPCSLCSLSRWWALGREAFRDGMSSLSENYASRAAVSVAMNETFDAYSDTAPRSCAGQPDGLAWIKPDETEPSKSSAKAGGY